MKKKTLLDTAPVRESYDGKDAFTLAEIAKRMNCGDKRAAVWIKEKVAKGEAERLERRVGQHWVPVYRAI